MKKVAINSSGGGSDLGIVSNGLTEKNITLNISNIIKNKLESNGVEVIMLRNGDESISYENRIKKLNKNDDILVISNTLNSGGSSGIEIIYSIKNKDTLARSLSDNLEQYNKTKYYQLRSPSNTTKDYYYITRESQPLETIIIRYGYADNANDAKIIKEEINNIADTVANTILKYIGVNDIVQNQEVVNNDYYVVKSGDTLYGIAKKFNMSVDELKNINGLKNNLININQKLKVNDNVKTYKVVKGDTLYGIAKKYNTTVDKLKDINNLKSNTINIGTILYLP